MKQENIKNKLNKILSHPTNFNDLPDYFNNGEDILKINNGINYNSDDYRELNFYSTDSLELYEKNLKTQPNNWKYRNKDITYKINSYGYRTSNFNEIDWKNSIVVFGCSNVFGVGLDEDETLTYHLSKLFNRNVINMGVGASSNELMLYNSLMLKIKYGVPYVVIFVWSSYDRSTYFSNEKDIIHIGSWHYKEKSSERGLFENYYINLQSSWTDAPIKTYYDIMLAKEIWKDTIYYDCSYFTFTCEYGKVDMLYPIDKNARDLSHPGSELSKKNAEFIFNKIKNNKK